MSSGTSEGQDVSASARPVARVVEELRERGICYQCHDLATGEVFGEQPVVVEYSRVKVVLAPDPRAKGHTILVWKPHRADFTELSPDETAELFGCCTRVANAIKSALGAERVYLVTMCDGDHNHLHIQLIPRYPGQQGGSRRLVDPRQPLVDSAETVVRLRTALEA